MGQRRESGTGAGQWQELEKERKQEGRRMAHSACGHVRERGKEDMKAKHEGKIRAAERSSAPPGKRKGGQARNPRASKGKG